MSIEKPNNDINSATCAHASVEQDKHVILAVPIVLIRSHHIFNLTVV